ncbi:GIY-YIG nuclease family protein [Nocardia sp. NPDC005825]|uniref:GIY-YIG nuclease family protein n=1 Tax=unclassified Nocardia TaxID=2637762 RepID=UPI0033DDB0CE
MTITRVGDLTLGHILAAAGLDPADVVLIRHSLYSEHSPTDLSPKGIRSYTREQLKNGGKFFKNPPPVWVVFLADSKTRCRLEVVYDNHGEAPHPNPLMRAYDLTESDALSGLCGRLQIDWGRDPINWAKWGSAAEKMPVLEIADRSAVPFLGYDSFVLTHAELQKVVADPRYAAWQTALGSVQGIYLIADTSTGKHYVGKADGGENILGRWRQYATDGHGGNRELRALTKADPQHARHYVFSLLRVFGPSTPTTEVDTAESHFKNALLSRTHGLNAN